MYPNAYFSLFPAFPRKRRAFVAMSFDPRFDPRWRNVLEPALQRIRTDDVAFQPPFRVDLGKASDAILTQILEEISDSTVIVADITAMHMLDNRPIRNANVMYEIGLAHAVRLPEEVVLFRSDAHHLDFDVQGVRVHSYDPDGNPEQARDLVVNTVIESLNGMLSKRRASLRGAAERLTAPAWMVLVEALKDASLAHPPTNLGNLTRAQAIDRLLDLGAIQAKVIQLTPDVLDGLGKNDPQLLTYKVTPFGHALVHYLGIEMGFLDPKIARLVKAMEGKASSGQVAPADQVKP